jgi:hypothetical protein
LTGAATARTKACGAVWSRLTVGCDGEAPVPEAPRELSAWVPVVVVDAAVGAACFSVVVPAAAVCVAAVPAAADAAVSVALVPVTGVLMGAVAALDPFVVAPVPAVGSVAAPEPPVAEPVWEALAPLPGEEPVLVLAEPLGCVEALPPALVVVPPDAELEPVDCVAPLEPVDCVAPLEPPVEPMEPVEPVEPVLWLLSPLVCAGVPDCAVSA